MHQIVQQIVDVMILIMACLLALFTIALLVIHYITSADENSMRRLKQQILRLINTYAHIEYLKGRIYDLLDPDGSVMALRDIHGIRSRRGVQVLEIVAREVSPAQSEALRDAVSADWYGRYMSGKLASRDRDTAILITKLVAELRAPGYTKQILTNLRRWPSNADAQQIGLLALFTRGQQEELVKLFSDPGFRLILSFRTLQELFHCYGGDHEALYRALFPRALDLYVRRACIRGVGYENCVGMCESVTQDLFSENLNLRMDAVRTVGKLKYAPAAPIILPLANHPSWELRCAAVDALIRLDPQGSYETILHCLSDKEWWVRFHAAQALMQYPCREKVVAAVAGGTDRYAYEMLRFMLERETLIKGGDAA